MKLYVAGAVADNAVTESSSAAPSPTPDLSSILGALATFGGSLGDNAPDGPARLDGSAGDSLAPRRPRLAFIGLLSPCLSVPPLPRTSC